MNITKLFLKIFKKYVLFPVFYLQVQLFNEEIRFELVIDGSKNVTHLTTVKYENKRAWHYVSLFIYIIQYHIKVKIKISYYQ